MGFLQRNRTFLLRRVLVRPWLLFNPLFRDRFVLALRVLARRLREKLSGKNTSDAAPSAAATTEAADTANEPNTSPRFGILAIGVEPQVQGGGVGQALMQACENQAWQLGFAKMNLSVHPGNAQAVRFYEKQGWRRVAEKGGWQGAMEKTNPEEMDTAKTL